MLVDLVQVTAADGMRLHGALELPASNSPDANLSSSLVDAWLCIHGTGSNFYSASTLAGIAPKLLATGAAVLRANTRGHDIVCTGLSVNGRWLQGAAFERVDESPIDLMAWIALLRERGFARVGLLGHSLGAIKAIYSLAADDGPDVAALVAVSPPRLSYSHFCQSTRADEFRQTYEAAETLVREGRGEELMFVKFPLSYYVSASGYLDRYGPAEQYNILKLLNRVRCSTLVTYGSSEVQSEVAFRGMPEAVEKLSTSENSLQVGVIAGADHIYTGCHDTLAGRILSWQKRLSRPA